jgi:hypothetical protein
MRLLMLGGVFVVSAFGLVFGREWTLQDFCGKYNGEATCVEPMTGWATCVYDEVLQCSVFEEPGPDFSSPPWPYVEWTENSYDKISGNYPYAVVFFEEKLCTRAGRCDREQDPENEEGYICVKEPSANWFYWTKDEVILDICTPCAVYSE